ncbi:MetQ/NlpA family ABC transporter substrate-binding protein [Sphingomonas immobilis]|uniref:MetQ/NlpA family ABC transporter substrate-binding protein n=1 Tax=Sphingomonas immobilis TaxID=3063997 RepID=A0ABT9A231_9SPHN|nr:MetQ/NlpA family ABC transporter substrate-binding protein [Sphingomonas sp. CA1-15]MDO7843893.1 MetQ/NlpA family ABC transporter substrate-binding protein [Sphingomonas sp. CA1-15]
MRRLIFLAALALAACSPGKGGSDGKTLSVAATAVPHAEILEAIKPQLAKEGVDLQIRVFNDYVQPNLQVDQKQIDVNYFETKPYLDEFNASRGTHLVPYAGIHVEPLGGYSKRWKALAALPQGATVAIPNEASNGGRALLLLQKAGLITLRKPEDSLATLRDIVANPKGLQFKELESATLPRVLDQVDLALINTNYALDAKLNPVRDALVIEDKNSPYVNFVVGRPGGETDPRVVKLIAALRSPATRAFIVAHYKGAVLPAF